MKFIFNKTAIKDNPNPKATIGFMCWNPFHYYVYKNIYQYLPEAEFIIGVRRYLNPSLEKENILRLAVFLNEKKIYWRFFNEEEALYFKKKFFKQYKAIVSALTLRPSIFRGLVDDSILKIRVLYGNAKDLYNFGLWNADFNLILTFGPYSQKFLEVYTNAKIVGNPKFDDWFNDTIDPDTINQLTKRLNPAKKTILYLPTHDTQKGMSSLPRFLKENKSIIQNYNFILKPHYLTSLDEKELVKELKKLKIYFFDERHDILSLLKVADYVISDNSGAIFDAILANKKIILFDMSEKIFDKKIFIGNRGFSGLKTYPESLEQVIKKQENAVGPVIQSFSELPAAISEADTKNAFFETNARQICGRVFEYQDGGCGARAAAEIKRSVLSFFSDAWNKTFIFQVQERENLIIRGGFEMQNKAPLLTKLQLIWKKYFLEE